MYNLRNKPGKTGKGQEYQDKQQTSRRELGKTQPSLSSDEDVPIATGDNDFDLTEIHDSAMEGTSQEPDTASERRTVTDVEGAPAPTVDHEDYPDDTRGEPILQEGYERGDGVGNINSPMSKDRPSFQNPNPVRETDPNYAILMAIQALAGKIDDQSNQLNSKLETINNKIEIKFTDLANQFEQHKVEIREIVNNMESRQNQLISDLNVQTEELSKTKEQLKDQELRLDTDQTNVQIQVSELKIEIQRGNKHQQILTERLEAEIKENHETQTQKLNDLEHKQNEDIDSLKNNFEQLSIQTRQNNTNLIYPYPFNTLTPPGNTLPKFNGKNKNPNEFVQKFKKYYQNLVETRGLSNSTTFKDLLDCCLEDNASLWWQIIRDNVKSLEEFEIEIKEKYWNHDIQKGIKRKLESQSYRPGGSLSRAEYFIEKVILLQNMSPRPEEKDIVMLMADHFEQSVQDAVRIQDINTIRQFERLLGREDVYERNSNSNQFKLKPVRESQNNSQRIPQNSKMQQVQPKYSDNLFGNNPNNNFHPRQNNFRMNNYNNTEQYNHRFGQNRYDPYNNRKSNNPYVNQQNNSYRPINDHSNDRPRYNNQTFYNRNLGQVTPERHHNNNYRPHTYPDFRQRGRQEEERNNRPYPTSEQQRHIQAIQITDNNNSTQPASADNSNESLNQ